MQKDNFSEIKKLLDPIKHTIQYTKKTIILYAGDIPEKFFFIEQGQVRIYKLDASGKELEIRRANNGDIFGEVFLFTESPYPTFAETVTDCTIISYNKSEILELINNSPKLSLFFINTLAKRCISLNQAIENTSLHELPVRLTRFLIHFLKTHNTQINNNQAAITLPFSKKDLASKLGTIPETLSRTFNKLSKDNLIAVNGANITILDYKTLFSYSGCF